MNGPMSTCYRLSRRHHPDMIDFAKIRLRGRGHRRYRRDLRTHPLLRWGQPLHPVDHPPHGCTAVASWGVWKFYANDRQVIEIRGSFHKFYHGGANWQDFTHAQFTEAVNTFCDTFQIFHGALHFLNLEVGVNIVPMIPTVDLLPRVLFHRKARPVRMDPGQGITIEHPGHFRYKIYDKAFEFGLPGEILRVEIHVDRMAILNRIGVTTATDLLDPACWGRLRAFLLGKVGELFIVEDDIAPDLITRPQRELLANAGRWEHWRGLSPNKRHRKRSKVERLWRLHHHPTLKADLLGRIAAKVDALTNDKAEGGMFDATRAHTPTNTRVVHHPITLSYGSQVRCHQDAVEAQTEVRRCLTCGRVITDQREGSRYCSEQRYGKDAKRCRNAGSNPRNNRLRSLERIERDPLLFDHRPYIQPQRTVHSHHR